MVILLRILNVPSYLVGEGYVYILKISPDRGINICRPWIGGLLADGIIRAHAAYRRIDSAIQAAAHDIDRIAEKSEIDFPEGSVCAPVIYVAIIIGAPEADRGSQILTLYALWNDRVNV